MDFHQFFYAVRFSLNKKGKCTLDLKGLNLPRAHTDRTTSSLSQDETLSGYRLVSRLFSFPADPRGRSVSDLPTRVFASKLPEWTSKVSYYNNEEFLRTHLAAENKVCGTLAIPVFEDDAQASCCAVFELVTAQERPNFNAEMDVMCKALQAVELSSSRPLRLDSQSLSLLQNAAVSEIKGILHAICHAHSLPLALTWVPRDYLESSGGREVDFDVDGNIDANRKSLWADETACYWKDTNMEGFIHACTTHPLKQGLGLVGKSLQSDKALFHLDVKKLHINEYPLVHHARRFGLGAAIAIRIRSAYTGPDDYVMEFFLPVDMKEAKEQESMLDSIASTIVSINRSLTKKPNIQLLEEKDFKFEFVSCDREDIPPASASATTSDDSAIDDMVDDIPEVAAMDDGDNNIIVIEDDDPPKEAAVAPVQRAKRKVANDRGITVQQLEPYYSGSMAHAARCLGVAPNTIKRVCRLNGISRWPSRKLNKVDRSLKKIQKEMESVEGVPGGLVFDPPTGRLLAAGSMIQLNPSDAFSFDVPAAANTTTTAPERQPDRKNKAPVTSTSTSDEWIKYLMSDG